MATITLPQLEKQDKTTRILVMFLLFALITCWGLMIWSTVRTYKLAAPMPQQFVTADGKTVMTADNIVAGKGGFQKADLMDYGSLYGMGSYYGIDYTAQYLMDLFHLTRENLALDQYHQSYSTLNAAQQYLTRTEAKNELRGIDLTANTVVLSTAMNKAMRDLQNQIAANLLKKNTDQGYTEAYSLTEAEAKDTASFFIYSSLTTVAHRPKSLVSWTNNWPYQPSVGNQPTVGTSIWSWASFTILFLGIGFVIVIFRLFIDREQENFRPAPFAFTKPTASQKAIWKYFVFVAVVFLLQILVGSIMAHDYADRASFYGLDINRYLPFAFLRDVHLQAPVVWIGLSWIGAALFLVPIISGREPKGQAFLVNTLFWITVTIVGGALLGNYLGIMGIIRDHWFWFGNQGLSYIELGRFWQIGFFIGLFAWAMIMLYALWPTLLGLFKQGKSLWSLFRIEHLLWYSALGVAFIYAFGLIPLTKINSSFTLTDFWRWWVVHLWVEWAFELFTVAMTAYFLMVSGLVSRVLAEKTVLFEWILILASGILGTGHHLYWDGSPKIWLSFGSIFSFLEVLPLFLLVLEAIQQYQHLKENTTFPYRLAYIYILGSAFWNFVGAGIFGGATINAPITNYYEHGTFLTLNHAHTAMFGAFGLLAIGLVYLCLRYLSGDNKAWGDRVGIWAFWLYNAGLVLWIALNFFPIGWAQLIAVYQHGYAYARSLDFYNTTLLWQWLRLPGDVVFSIGALLMAWDFLRKTRSCWRCARN